MFSFSLRNALVIGVFSILSIFPASGDELSDAVSMALNDKSYVNGQYDDVVYDWDWYDPAFDFRKRLTYFARKAVGMEKYVYGVPMICELTQLGEDADAYAISAILKEAMVFKYTLLTEKELFDDLESRKNWKSYNVTDESIRFEEGDVVYRSGNADQGWFSDGGGARVAIIVEIDPSGNIWVIEYSAKYKSMIRGPLFRNGMAVRFVQRIDK